MANKASTTTSLKKLQAENAQLKAENKQLKQKAGKNGAKSRFGAKFWRQLGAIFLLSLAIALLVAGNLLFWTGNTIVKSDRYAQSITPIIKNTEVQKAVATYTTDKIFSNVNVDDAVTNVLPPRADFLAPTIADNLQSKTDETLQKILANPDFQDKWNRLQVNAHDRFVTAVKNHGSDGAIDVNEVYQQLSAQLKDTKLAFLANKPLPPKVGDIQIASGSGLSMLNRIITHIDLWRTLAILLFLAFVAVGLWLSRNRRKALVLFATGSAIAMLLTLISLRVVRENIASHVNATYAEAVRQTMQIILHPLVIQTATLMVAFLLVVFVAWVSGPTKSALALKARVNNLFAGKLHKSIFSKGENAFTLWLGKYKRTMQWLAVAIVAVIALMVRLTPRVLVVSSLVLLVIILVIELLSAPAQKRLVT